MHHTHLQRPQVPGLWICCRPSTLREPNVGSLAEGQAVRAELYGVRCTGASLAARCLPARVTIRSRHERMRATGGQLRGIKAGAAIESPAPSFVQVSVQAVLK